MAIYIHDKTRRGRVGPVDDRPSHDKLHLLYVTHDGRLIFSQNVSFLALTVWDL